MTPVLRGVFRVILEMQGTIVIVEGRGAGDLMGVLFQFCEAKRILGMGKGDCITV